MKQKVIVAGVENVGFLKTGSSYDDPTSAAVERWYPHDNSLIASLNSKFDNKRMIL